jgi:hypothetical protein
VAPPAHKSQWSGISVFGTQLGLNFVKTLLPQPQPQLRTCPLSVQ